MSRRRGERGQATVELALALPVVLLGLLLVIQVGVVVAARVAVVGAARDGARRGALDDDDAAARRAATASIGEEGATVVVERHPDPDDPALDVVQVRVRKVVSTDVPLVGPLLPDVPVDAVARMPGERR